MLHKRYKEDSELQKYFRRLNGLMSDISHTQNQTVTIVQFGLLNSRILYTKINKNFDFFNIIVRAMHCTLDKKYCQTCLKYLVGIIC